MKYALAYDLGTGSVKAAVFDETGRKIQSTGRKYPLFFPKDGWKEQRPSDWWNGICDATKELLGTLSEEVVGRICGIGISGHSLGVVAIDAQGELLQEYTPIWSDARAAAQANAFFEKYDYLKWYRATGCGFNPELYAIFKILWYKENLPEIYRRTACFLGTKDYINYKMCGIVATDRSYASGSGAFSLEKNDYDDDILAAAGLPRAALAEVRPSHGVIGRLTKSAGDALGLPEGLPIVAGGVDNALMSLGAGCFRQNDFYASLGSSAWIAACTSAPVTDAHTSLYCWAHCVDGMFLPSSGIYSAGTSREWMQQMIVSEANPYGVFDALAENAPAGSNGVVFYPVLAGPAPCDVPTDSGQAKGLIHGITLATTKGDLARATFEGMAFELSLSLEALSRKIALPDTVTLVGGGTRSGISCQIYADVFRKTVAVSDVGRDAAAFGAAALVFKGLGVWVDYTPVSNAFAHGVQYIPDPISADQYQKLKKRFREVCSHA